MTEDEFATKYAKLLLNKYPDVESAGKATVKDIQGLARKAAMKIVPRRLTGRCLNGAERDGGTRYHAVDESAGFSEWGVAICGAKPGLRGNGFSYYEGEKVTCPRCLKRLSKLGVLDGK